MREKKEIAIEGYSPKVCTSTYTHGNTIIKVSEHFKEEGPAISELIEKVILYEGNQLEKSQHKKIK